MENLGGVRRQGYCSCSCAGGTTRLEIRLEIRLGAEHDSSRFLHSSRLGRNLYGVKGKLGFLRGRNLEYRECIYCVGDPGSNKTLHAKKCTSFPQCWPATLNLAGFAQFYAVSCPPRQDSGTWRYPFEYSNRCHDDLSDAHYSLDVARVPQHPSGSEI